ncbi:hypothetical protein C8Q69DRAFT_135979 [Paecilomyces variotii]|uniref:Uncharacterized protein n=1 Tax=Byssochlamys spectabilis TaxID=264951 RepID=A0A443I050_BYSSP|nr:hypothetical protein C8Q69DRAFT_135979 [Paecilomyces variotii]RWQ97430.1 hypothetical protein C8Q69DRAFT_135979 [Paecilomyces variotii]
MRNEGCSVDTNFHHGFFQLLSLCLCALFSSAAGSRPSAALQSDRVRFLFSGRGASRQDDRWRIWAHSTAKKSSAKLSSDVEALQFCRPLLLLFFFFWLSRASRGSAPTPKTTPSEPNRSPLSTRPLPSLSPRLIPPPSLLPLRRPTPSLSISLSLSPSLHPSTSFQCGFRTAWQLVQLRIDWSSPLSRLLSRTPCLVESTRSSVSRGILFACLQESYPSCVPYLLKKIRRFNQIIAVVDSLRSGVLWLSSVAFPRRQRPLRRSCPPFCCPQ